MRRGVYERTPEIRAKHGASLKKYHAEHPETGAKMGASRKKYYEDPENRAKLSASILKHHAEHPEIGEKISTGVLKHHAEHPETAEKMSASRLKYFADHPDAGAKHSAKISGENHWNWQGDDYNRYYPLEFNEELKEQIRDRDDHTCQVCKLREEQLDRALDVHHIDYDKNNCEEENLISLCRSCHMTTNHNREYWIERLGGVL